MTKKAIDGPYIYSQDVVEHSRDRKAELYDCRAGHRSETFNRDSG
jgi:hypothetical protein